ncbi:hypothetical protein EG329_009035 [Mollisiaceae sp. DMI_Dod_QoI]|nr:hypothetical protein EG329_009035 [Helotiales sp. DMI_Dod_QoI]
MAKHLLQDSQKMQRDCDEESLSSTATEGVYVLNQAPYLTLSHCWGNAKVLQLTQDSLDDFLEDIPIANLPKTFLDAIFIVAKLGYEYIWIDSLCIMQDSLEDWSQEMVYWECVSAKASEMRPQMSDFWNEAMKGRDDEYEGMGMSTMTAPGLKHTFTILLSLCRDSNYYVWEQHWWKLIAEYTASQMSFDKDKWVAISGLATKVEQQSGRKLIHGLWEDFLPDELLWCAQKRGRRLEMGAPSWSWLAIDAPVDRDWRLADTERFKTERTVSAFLSAAKSGGDRIVLQAPIASFHWTVQGDWRRKIEGADAHFKVLSWEPDVVPDEGLKAYAIQFGRHKSKSTTSTRPYESSFTWYSGLVITPVDASLKVWSRLGFFLFGWREDVFGNVEVAPRYLGTFETVSLV